MHKISDFKQSKSYPNLFVIWRIWAIGKIEQKRVSYDELLREYKQSFPTRKLAREYRLKHINKYIKFKQKLVRERKSIDYFCD